jgi:hypothetical protein
MPPDKFVKSIAVDKSALDDTNAPRIRVLEGVITAVSRSGSYLLFDGTSFNIGDPPVRVRVSHIGRSPFIEGEYLAVAVIRAVVVVAGCRNVALAYRRPGQRGEAAMAGHQLSTVGLVVCLCGLMLSASMVPLSSSLVAAGLPVLLWGAVGLASGRRLRAVGEALRKLSGRQDSL